MNETPETTEKISQSCNYRKHMIFPSLHPPGVNTEKKVDIDSPEGTQIK